MGSKVEILGDIYTAEDTGGAIKGKKVDICVNSHSEAYQRGVLKNIPVYIIRVGKRLKFEVINDKNAVVMNTTSPICVPCETQINSMIRVGYKFRLNNKIITKKKLIEFIEEIKNE